MWLVAVAALAFMMNVNYVMDINLIRWNSHDDNNRNNNDNIYHVKYLYYASIYNFFFSCSFSFRFFFFVFSLRIQSLYISNESVGIMLYLCEYISRADGDLFTLSLLSNFQLWREDEEQKKVRESSYGEKKKLGATVN